MTHHTGNYREELEAFEQYLLNHSLKRSRQREIILERFLETEGHLSVDDLYRIIQRTNPEIGRTTIYRTLKLLCDAEIAKAIELQDGLTRFEILNKDEHHDHMVCTLCGTIVEFTSEAVEKIQEQIAEANGFTVDSHRHQIFGRCQKCRRRRSSSKTRGTKSRSRTAPERPLDVDGASALS
jgi:Fur family ferric uptake transcriptional regulator